MATRETYVKMQIKQILKYIAYWWGMGAGMQRG